MISIPQGTVALDSGTGTSEAAAATGSDVGRPRGRPGGFRQQLRLRHDQPDQQHLGRAGRPVAQHHEHKPEAVYANELIVPSGATLNLNNLHLYVRGEQVSGTVVGGTVTVVPSGGSIALNTPTPGTLTPAGAIDNWTFYGTAGESITVQLNPGSGGTNPALSPLLNWGQVALLDASGNSLATASSASSGAIATISGFSLPASGTYTIQVQAPPGRQSSTGNYVLSAYNVTPNVQPLTVNQPDTGTIRSAYGVDQWTSPARPASRSSFNVINSSGGVEFDLTGPGGYTAFSDLSSDSGLITLPSTGSYVLTAHGNGGQGGVYAFELEQTR